MQYLKVYLRLDRALQLGRHLLFQGDNCPSNMGEDNCQYGLAILLTSGVTCALLVIDLATRYFLRKKEEEELPGLKQVPAPTAQPAAFGFEPITEEDRDLLLHGEKQEVTLSKVLSYI